VKVGRNEPCPCGSGRKFKHCHGSPSVQPNRDTDRSVIARGKRRDVTDQDQDPLWIFLSTDDIGREFASLFDNRRLAEAESRVLSAYDDLLARTLTKPDVGTVDSEIGELRLNQIRQQIETDLFRRAQRYSPMEWLWYLRLLPTHYWAGTLPTTFLYDSALAETVTAGSQKPGQIPKSENFSFPLDKGVADYISEFCAGVRYLSQIHTNLRWAGKGARFDFSSAAYGRALPSQAVREAVELYDTRASSPGESFLSRTGSVVVENDSQVQELEIIGVHRQPTVYGQMEPQVPFGLAFFSLETLGQFNQVLHAAGIRWWSEETALLAAFLRAVYPLITASLKRVIRVGWLVTRINEIDSAPMTYFEDAVRFASRLFPGVAFPQTFNDLFQSVAAIEGSVWPFRCGPAIRITEDLLCLDLFSATMMLRECAVFKASGDAEGNFRGHHFEQAVQRIIDQTPWKPPPSLQSLVGFKLRDQNKDFSDLDAVGLKGSELLLVSCKSRISSDAYEQGDRKAIFGIAELIEKAIEKWREVVRFVQRKPDCLKAYDLSGLNIIGVVCVPFVPYLAIGDCTKFEAPGLRAVVSIGELQSWLTGTQKEI
jgi:hypothetical protein